MSYRPRSKTLSELPAREVRTIAIPNENHGTRWSTPNWLTADLARITDVSGKLPANHLTDRVNAHQAFARWLETAVKPETFDWIMSNENAFAISYSAYRHLAGFQARMKPNKTNPEAKPGESTTHE